jgi:hypothetical protein
VKGAPLSCSASLSFAGDNLDPDELRRVVPLKAKRWNRKGDLPRRSRSTSAPLRPARVGTRFSDSKPHITSDDINDHVRFLLGIVSEHVATLREIIEHRHLRWEIVCFFDIDAPNVDPKPFLRTDVLLFAERLGIQVVPSLA